LLLAGSVVKYSAFSASTYTGPSWASVSITV
jgi:hypothetical protein